ncbi:DUF1033 family protein [Macrococcus equipercicus]|uniref:DUF1033 family protein n=1 Tax=Macrococcus equipercicus TaxID=69967 RepID=A0A9Q9F0C7_9STAP|nr:DUF1033 family protein [Macrococcus equipercicus]KAA1040247.1 DUF1033 family protein [Macrococcus equipercicus]UTH12808.1 DUF1033 family protein [Macrococcus equipercicus]
MFQLKVIRADYEGWWLFEDWPEKVIMTQTFQTAEELAAGYEQQLEAMRQKFPNEIIGKYNIHAFYRNCELEFCEECDEDLQIYYSLIALEGEQVLQGGKHCKCLN